MILTVVARQYSEFTALAYALATAAFLAGPRDPSSEEPDVAELPAWVGAAVEQVERRRMCRSIKTLLPSFAEAVGPEDVRAAVLQYVRKLAGMRSPAPHNA